MDRCQHPDCAFQVRLISVHNHIHYDGLPLDQLYPAHCNEPCGGTDTGTTFYTAQSHQEASEAGNAIEELEQPEEPEEPEELEELEELEWSEEPEQPEELRKSEKLEGLEERKGPEETEEADNKAKKVKERIGKSLRKPESRVSAIPTIQYQARREGQCNNILRNQHTPFEMNLYQASWFHKLDLSEDASSLAEEDLEFIASKPFEASARQQLRRGLRHVFKPSSLPIRRKLRQWKQAVVRRLGEG